MSIQQPWYAIGSCEVSFGWSRTNGPRRLRFILLGPFKDPSRLRPTVAAGDISLDDGAPAVDHGALGPDQAAAITRLAIEHMLPRRPS